MEDVIIHSGNMDGSDLTSYSTDMQEKEIVPTSSTNSIIDVVKSEFADNSARHVAQLNKMSLENIIL
ncbi:20477_t:CDS:2 [Rhizophagus irregularis]|nr:20477_t:CDS:2 [Rhizophagus irregularis]